MNSNEYMNNNGDVSGGNIGDSSGIGSNMGNGSGVGSGSNMGNGSGISSGGMGTENGATPIIPLPPLGSNLPVFPETNFTANTDANGNVNVTPIMPRQPSEEGAPVFPGKGSMNAGNNMNIRNIGGMNTRDMDNSMGSDHTPLVPLPNPGEGGPVFSGNNASGFQGTLITVLPRPVTSCFYCNSNSFGTVRFFNAAIGYQPFVISINNRTVVDALSYSEVSDYGRVSTGYQTITVAARNGYIYVSKQVRVTVGATLTIAIVNTAGGLDFVEVNDAFCYTPFGGACIRVSNLSYNAGPLTLSTYSGNISFQMLNLWRSQITSGYFPHAMIFMFPMSMRRCCPQKLLSEAVLSTRSTCLTGMNLQQRSGR